jgi:hypothetical protein
VLGLLNERAEMWKGAGLASLRHDPSIYMKRWKKSRKDPGRIGQYFNIEPSKSAAEYLFTNSDWKFL